MALYDLDMTSQTSFSSRSPIVAQGIKAPANGSTDMHSLSKTSEAVALFYQKAVSCRDGELEQITIRMGAINLLRG